MEYLPLPVLDNQDPVQGQIKWLNALLHGGRCIGYEKLNVDDAPLVSLTVPAGAKYALIYVQAAVPTVDKNRVVHFREDGGNPTTGVAGEGIPLPDDGIYECKGAANLAAFKVIGIEAGMAHTIRVLYYGQG